MINRKWNEQKISKFTKITVVFEHKNTATANSFSVLCMKDKSISFEAISTTTEKFSFS